jgi:hypothetical protein
MCPVTVMLNLVIFEESKLEWEVTNEDVASSSSDEILVLRQSYHSMSDGVIRIERKNCLMDSCPSHTTTTTSSISNYQARKYAESSYVMSENMLK